MFKKILIIISILVVAVYLVIAMTHLNLHPEKQRCRKIEVVVKDTSDVDLITKSGVIQALKKHNLQLVGKRMSDIDTKVLENIARRYPMVSQVECYKTLGGKIRIEVVQRIPILHVMNYAGEDYYLDNMGHIIPAQTSVTYRPIVTGKVDKWFASNFLYKLGVYIYYNSFWRSAIQQINVLPGWDIELVPRIGNHVVYMGRIDNFDKKLDRLIMFYQRGLNKVGWNKYSNISLEFDNQIICTKHTNVMTNDSIK